VKVTNEKLFDMMVKLDNKMTSLEDRIMVVEAVMNRGRGAVTLLAWLGGIVAIVIGYFYQR
jgi:hypothetical protein|tara:strand:- start:7034 stop:7216 length:183 start_codon:yes stop_codon:yes gene_type:complete